MRRLERWSLRIGCGLAVLTGVVYGWLRYLGAVKGEFGPEPSPWQPFWQHAHVLAAPVLLFALGVAVRGDIPGDAQPRRAARTADRARAPRPRRTPGARGYAIQVVTGAGLRNALGGPMQPRGSCSPRCMPSTGRSRAAPAREQHPRSPAPRVRGSALARRTAKRRAGHRGPGHGAVPLPQGHRGEEDVGRPAVRRTLHRVGGCLGRELLRGRGARAASDTHLRLADDAS